jgi:hypothetical protein
MPVRAVTWERNPAHDSDSRLADRLVRIFPILDDLNAWPAVPVVRIHPLRLGKPSIGCSNPVREIRLRWGPRASLLARPPPHEELVS